MRARFVPAVRRSFDDGTPIADSGQSVRYRATAETECLRTGRVTSLVVVGSSSADAANRLNLELRRLAARDVCEVPETRHIGQV